MLILTWIAILAACFAYLFSLQRWIYRENILLGLVSLMVCFPLIIVLTSHSPAHYLRAVPLFGVGMFLHRYGFRILMQIKLLWFTTLTVLVVQGYYAISSHFLGFRLWQ